MYDVIVIGSGSGGVVASRLSRIRHQRSLLEAGPDPGDNVPDAVRYVRLGSGVDEADWDYFDRQTRGALPRGRILGGSSSVSELRAADNPEDYDGWAWSRPPSWSWEQCLPYFVSWGRSRVRPSCRTTEAPDRSIRRALNDAGAGRSACLELGREGLDDLNRPGAFGVGPLPGKRPAAPGHPADLHRRPGRPNLTSGRHPGRHLVIGTVEPKAFGLPRRVVEAAGSCSRQAPTTRPRSLAHRCWRTRTPARARRGSGAGGLASARICSTTS